MIYARPSATRPQCKSWPSVFAENARGLTMSSALAGFLLSLTPLSCILMGWRGAGGSGASDTGVYFFFGGLLMILGSIGEVLSLIHI